MATSTSALLRYETSTHLESPDGLLLLAADLRCEADALTGDQRRKRADRAQDCESRALRLRWREQHNALPDFVPVTLEQGAAQFRALINADLEIDPSMLGGRS